MDGLIVGKSDLDKILSGEKKWDIRGNNTRIRGRIKLIERESQEIVGEVDLVDTKPLSESSFNLNRDKHCITDISFAQLRFGRPSCWVMENPKRYEKPEPCECNSITRLWVNNI